MVTQGGIEYKRGALYWRIGVIALFSWCLFWQGGWQWVDNHWAIIPGVSDPAQAGLELAELLGMANQTEARIKAPSAETEAGLPVGLVEGNGDEDDDRVEPYVLPPFLAARSHIQVVMKKPVLVNRRRGASYKDMGHLKVAPTETTHVERRRVASYKDLGHLKVGPAGEAVLNSISSLTSVAIVRPSQTIWGGLNLFPDGVYSVPAVVD